MKKTFFNFNNTYHKLPKTFYQEIKPKPVSNPKLIEFNFELSKFLNVNNSVADQDQGKLIFSGNSLPAGAKPIAMVYAGHQFGNFVPQLGDGRAILIGEQIAKNGERFDIQLKGSGRTAFSRQGDGRSPLGPVIREYILSESLHYLGIKSTRSLAMVSTGETVLREEPLKGGILTRVASSHIRIGTFEFFFFKEDFSSLKKLADYSITRHFARKNKNKPYEYLLKSVIKLQAELVAKWMSVGFIHGVMNTDNTSISGETIDFGPCAFMDEYHPTRVFSYIDQGGRYSYINQGKIMLWNLSKFAECLIPLLDNNFETAKKKAINCLEIYPKYFEECWLDEMRKKLGFKKKIKDDHILINDFFKIMQKNNMDFTLSFRNLSKITSSKINSFFEKELKASKETKNWFEKWNKRLETEDSSRLIISKKMLKINPIYIPRNHLVESVIHQAMQENNFSKMRELLELVREPFKEKKSKNSYGLPPKPDEVITNTFCGT